MTTQSTTGGASIAVGTPSSSPRLGGTTGNGDKAKEKAESPVLAELRYQLTGRSEAGHDERGDHDEGHDHHPRHEHERERSAVAIPVAAIKSLLFVIRRSEAETMMGLQVELAEASRDMMEYARTSSHALLGGRSYIALASGCELFMKYVTRCFLELPDFDQCRLAVLERGERFAGISLAARDRIAELGQAFVQDGQVVLTHGWSRVVTTLLLKAASSGGRHFSVIVLEGRPDAGGAKAARVYGDAGIPCTVVLDAAMGYVMERVDLVVVGAEGVVENGGIVNKVGTYALGVVARELGKPFYVAAESYKFARLFPLNQSDLPEHMGGQLGDKLNFVDTASWEATGGLVGRRKESPPRGPTTNKLEGDEGGGGGGGDGGDGEGSAAGPSSSPSSRTMVDFNAVPGLVRLPGQVKVENPPCDYTPAKYITLLFTDLGVLTPSAVSDELIRLYQ